MSTANALKIILFEKLKNGSLVLPTLPEIALKVRKMVNDPDCNLKMVAALIAQDASLSARLICIANTSHYSRAVRVDNLPAALTRIGMTQIKNIVTALAIEQLFVSDNELVASHLKSSWVDSTEVTAFSLALFSAYSKHHRHNSLQADAMTLIALVHNIGVLPILAEADHYPEVFAEAGFLNAAVEELKCVIGGAVAKAWNFSDEAIETLLNLIDDEYQTAHASYLDFVRLALLCYRHQDELAELNEQLEPYMAKGILASADELLSDEFKQDLAAARETFA